MRDTIKQLSEDGIPAFVDKAGREWSPEAYVRMDIRTTAANTARQAQFDRCEQYNIKLIQVDAHRGARPLCAPYQGRIYSLDGTSGTCEDGGGKKIDYVPLSSTSYGEPAGLFGINCGHHQYPFVTGINMRRYFPTEDLEENSKEYKQFQRQRALERNIRKSKRECMMLDASGNSDSEEFKKASAKLKEKRKRYKDYCEETGLRQHNDRTQVYGFDKSKSSKAAWAEKKAAKGLTNGNTSGNISLNNLNTKIKEDKQNQHIENSDKWKEACAKEKLKGNNPKSYLYKSVDPQAIVDEAVLNPNTITEYTKKSIYPRQYYVCGTEVGKVYDAKVGDYVPTKKVAIVYSGKGTHVFPVIDKKK